MKLFATVLAAAITVCGALSAQTNELMTVNFATPIVVNGVTLPAGKATIQVLHTSGTMMLAIHSDKGGNANVLVYRIDDDTNQNEPSVVLDHKGNEFRLNRVVMTDHSALQVLDAE